VDLYGAGLRLAQLHSMIFPDLKKDELFEKEGDHPLILDYIATMAYPLAMEANLLDPDFLILGGAIPAMPGFPLKTLEEQVLTQCHRPADREGPVFLASAASTMPGVVCAAQYTAAALGLLG
jgi:allose kinase